MIYSTDLDNSNGIPTIWRSHGRIHGWELRVISPICPGFAQNWGGSDVYDPGN